MRKNIISLCILLFLITACVEESRLSTIDTIAYGDAEVTVLFKDGLVITTSYYDTGLEPGDKARVLHRKDGDIEIRK